MLPGQGGGFPARQFSTERLDNCLAGRKKAAYAGQHIATRSIMKITRIFTQVLPPQGPHPSDFAFPWRQLALHERAVVAATQAASSSSVAPPPPPPRRHPVSRTPSPEPDRWIYRPRTVLPPPPPPGGPPPHGPIGDDPNFYYPTPQGDRVYSF